MIHIVDIMDISYHLFELAKTAEKEQWSVKTLIDAQKSLYTKECDSNIIIDEATLVLKPVLGVLMSIIDSIYGIPKY